MFFPRNQVKTKKKQTKNKVFTAIWDNFIRAGWLFFVWSSSAQISMGGRLNLDWGKLTLDGGTRPLRPLYNLSTVCGKRTTSEFGA